MSKVRDKNTVKVEGGKVCPKCEQRMQRYVHADGWQPKAGRGFYRWWDVCICGHHQQYFEAYVKPSQKGPAQTPPTTTRGERRARRKERKAERQAIESAITPSKDAKTAFYASWEWRTLRMKAFIKFGRRCQCCGAAPGDRTVSGEPVRLVVDHILPISTHWHLRLDPNNLQVACDECNQGKGGWLVADFRGGA